MRCASGEYEDGDKRGHMEEEARQVNIGSFGKYGATEFPTGENTGGTDLGHHGPPPKR